MESETVLACSCAYTIETNVENCKSLGRVIRSVTVHLIWCSGSWIMASACSTLANAALWCVV